MRHGYLPSGFGVLAALFAAVLAGVLLTTHDAVGEREDGGSAVVAVVGREAVTAEDVVAFWYERYREGWIRVMENLIDERIADHEIQRLGLSLPPDVLEKAVRREVEAREKQLRETYGEDADLGETVRDGYGVDLETWKREILAPRLRMQHLLMRVVRLDSRRRERVKVRVIVLDGEARARRVRKKLEEGADFCLTALKESLDPTAESGGDLPAIARGDLTLEDVEARLFEAAPASLVGPLAVTLEGRTRWHLYKVVGRTEPWTGTRPQLLDRLEKDLEEEPLGRGEFERWRARMRRDFRVRVLDPKGRPVVLPSSGR